MAPKRYKVRLTNEEREQVIQVISRGKAAAKKLTHAHILLKADESPQWGPAWKDERIAEALNKRSAPGEESAKRWLAMVREGTEP